MRHQRRITFEGVEGLQAGRFNLGINTSVTCYRLGSTLIDAGAPLCWPSVRKFVKEKPVRQLLLTHHHEDHSGNAGRIWRKEGATVQAHADALAPLKNGWIMPLYRRLVWGRPKPVLAEALSDVVELEEGRLCVIPTPGHSEDHVCFLEPDRGWLFSGDLFISRRPRILSLDECLNLQIASIRKVMKYEFRVIFCAHRGIVREGRQALCDKLIYFETLREKARQLRETGLPVRRIARELLGREGLTSMVTGYHFSKRNLIRSCLEAREEGMEQP